MCLAVPGRVDAIDESAGAWSRTARVSFGGVQKVVNVSLVPETVVGDYVLVHVGVAIQRIDESEALRTYALLEELGQTDELGEDDEEIQ